MTDLTFCTTPTFVRIWIFPILRTVLEGASSVTWCSTTAPVSSQSIAIWTWWIFCYLHVGLKLDAHTMFEWQCHSLESMDDPHYQQLLSSIDLHAQASESTVSVATQRAPRNDALAKKIFAPGRWWLTYHLLFCHYWVICYQMYRMQGETSIECMFQVQDHDSQRRDLLWKPMDCVLTECDWVTLSRNANCCTGVEFVINPFTLSFMLKERRPSIHPPRQILPPWNLCNTLLMTCNVQVLSSDGLAVRDRALLDSAMSASFGVASITNPLFFSPLSVWVPTQITLLERRLTKLLWLFRRLRVNYLYAPFHLTLPRINYLISRWLILFLSLLTR